MAKIFDTNFKEIFSSQIIAVIISMFAGTLLLVYAGKIILIPGMLILLPGFLEMRGNISSSFAARITSGLFLGVITDKKDRIVKGNIIASFALVLIISFLLGLLAFAFTLIVFKILIVKLIFIPIIAALIASIIQLPLTLGFTFYLFMKGHDPNNIIGPVITSIGDIISIASLLLAILIL